MARVKEGGGGNRKEGRDYEGRWAGVCNHPVRGCILEGQPGSTPEENEWGVNCKPVAIRPGLVQVWTFNKNGLLYKIISHYRISDC